MTSISADIVDAPPAPALLHPATRNGPGAARGGSTTVLTHPAMLGRPPERIEDPVAIDGSVAHEDLQRVLADLRDQGRSLCSLLGMTSEWGHARWAAGATPAHLVGTFRVVVHGDIPDHDTMALLARRLARHGWAGTIVSESPVARLDCTRSGLEMRLTARGGIVTLALQGRPIRAGRSLAMSVLAGVFDEDEIA